ncbi:hypothetical protein AQJ43_17955 [Streptomyces avermitilis]|uniref:Uncharacterized protein n=1 Tax=Streptomyces avermitilis TaxID=33903 RepID=A0A4D4M6W4_STRAX|nr:MULTISPECIES: hypothetical protein [Streptomyces]KUN53321.1 hypothetical protein AQJ43_17955 [Streptomyces avermitilis]BBJ55710.1 hypothetical protein SAVMC3_83390 [Streptomyces avermitilis]GDY67666.1 hypothetical protein SAV14893_070590 [Streptomyces avermitilis]GDY72027.1 hypothetical protein SAV31267_015120 [Streptomyces avermitilis]GDY81188.1 hypothetical protein SAVCW2_03870 [Streptomyces avermitilis]
MDPWFGNTTIASTLNHQALGYIYDTERPAAQGDRMLPGDMLVADQYLVSQNGSYTFTYQKDGNLVLYRNDGSTSSTTATRASAVRTAHS